MLIGDVLLAELPLLPSPLARRVGKKAHTLASEISGEKKKAEKEGQTKVL